MGILNRLSGLLKSNANAAVDAMEDPRKVLEQVLADLEADRKASERKRLEVATAAKLTEKNLAAQDARSRDLEAKAMAAVKAGNEALARAALDEKAKADASRGELAGTLAEQRKMVEEITAALASMDGGIAQAKARRAELLRRLSRAEAAKRQQEDKASTGSARDALGETGAFDGFDRMVEKIERREAEAEARAEAEPTGPSRQLAAPSTDAEERLAALKAKLGK